VVDESAECQAIRPGGGEVLNLHILKQEGAELENQLFQPGVNIVHGKYE
jgi:hypothetical protein